MNQPTLISEELFSAIERYNAMPSVHHRQEVLVLAERYGRLSAEFERVHGELMRLLRAYHAARVKCDKENVRMWEHAVDCAHKYWAAREAHAFWARKAYAHSEEYFSLLGRSQYLQSEFPFKTLERGPISFKVIR